MFLAGFARLSGRRDAGATHREASRIQSRLSMGESGQTFAHTQQAAAATKNAVFISAPAKITARALALMTPVL